MRPGDPRAGLVLGLAPLTADLHGQGAEAGSDLADLAGEATSSATLLEEESLPERARRLCLF